MLTKALFLLFSQIPVLPAPVPVPIRDTATMEVKYTRDNEGDSLFVVQTSTSASTATGGAQTGSVLKRIMCVTAKRTVPTVRTK